eukprot:1848526-Rhodomonas_salina.2
MSCFAGSFARVQKIIAALASRLTRAKKIRFTSGQKIHVYTVRHKQVPQPGTRCDNGCPRGSTCLRAWSAHGHEWSCRREGPSTTISIVGPVICTHKLQVHTGVSSRANGIPKSSSRASRCRERGSLPPLTRRHWHTLPHGSPYDGYAVYSYSCTP